MKTILKKTAMITFMCLAVMMNVNAQTTEGVAINATNSSPDASAILDVSSSTKGILVPRMTTAQRMAVENPANGLLIYDQEEGSFFFFDAGTTTWKRAGSNWSNTGTDLFRENGNVSIGTSTSLAKLHVSGGSVLFEGGTGGVPVSGGGSRMMWVGSKGAFRAGAAGSDEWDDINIGNFSFAAGTNTKAKGFSSTAFGSGSQATGDFSFCLGNSAGTMANGSFSYAVGSNAVSDGSFSYSRGNNAVASQFFGFSEGNNSISNGNFAFARGNGVQATNSFAFATGENGTVASGPFSFAYGSNAKSAGDFSYAFGNNSNANGPFSFAYGNTVTASGSFAFAFGNSNTSSGNNSFCIGNGNTASGANSFATGNAVNATAQNAFGTGNSVTAGGVNSFATGNSATTTGQDAFATGHNVSANGTCSFAIGHSVTAQENCAIVLGKGADNTNRLINNSPNSLAVGFNSDQATLFVGTSSGIGTTGNVGISTTTPSSKMDINGVTGYDQLRLRSSYTPTGTSDPNGNIGDVAWDENYFYIKTAAGWKRFELGTF